MIIIITSKAQRLLSSIQISASGAPNNWLCRRLLDCKSWEAQRVAINCCILLKCLRRTMTRLTVLRKLEMVGFYMRAQERRKHRRRFSIEKGTNKTRKYSFLNNSLKAQSFGKSHRNCAFFVLTYKLGTLKISVCGDWLPRRIPGIGLAALCAIIRMFWIFVCLFCRKLIRGNWNCVFHFFVGF